METANIKEKYAKTLEQIYATVDLLKVLAPLEPVDRGNHLVCTCPACGQRRAFAYKDRKLITCNRINSCGYRATILQYVAGDERPRGDCFKNAVGYLADMAGLPRPHQVRKETLNPRKPSVAYRKQPKGQNPIWLYHQMVTAQRWFETSKVAQDYLLQRRIPVQLAQKYQVGFAPYRRWPHYNSKKELIRQWRPGRIVFPIWHGSNVTNLYGRVAADCPKKMRHDFLPGPKGVWNGKVFDKYEMVFLPEGIFDALSLVAAGYRNTGAINGCHGIDWKKVKASVICFCLDPDTIGGKRWTLILTQAHDAGKKVVYMPKSNFMGCKDLNQLWVKNGKIKTTTKLFKPAN